MTEKTPAYQFDRQVNGWVPAVPTSATKRAAIVQLARYGDIVNALPIAYALAMEGNEVHWYCDVNFMDLFEAVSYVFIHPVNLGDSMVQQVAAIAENDGYDEVIVPQVHGNKLEPPVKVDNFTLKQWANAGLDWLDRYHQYRPIFNRRDLAGEASACEVLPVEDGRPILLINFASHSSPYERYAMQTEWVHATFGASHRIFDLTTLAPGKPGKAGQPAEVNPLELKRIHHLLGFLSRAQAIITVDTATLHFAAATNTPTLQLSAGKDPQGQPSSFYDSECRKNVVFKCSYDQSIRPAWRNRMATIIRNREFKLGMWVQDAGADNFDPVGGRKIVHVADWFTGNAGDNPRVFRARATWEELRRDPDYTIRLHELQPGQRSSRDLGDIRRLPYIRDIIDYGCAGAKDDEIVVFTNSDVCLVPEAMGEIRRKLVDAPCCFSRRIDVDDCAPKRRLKELRRAISHVGADLFAMTKRFWLENRKTMPDLFLSAEGWDFCCRHWMLAHNIDAEMRTPIIWHQSHSSVWAQADVIHSSPSQVHNRRECEKFARANGLDAAVYSDGNKFLFKADGTYAKAKGLATA